MRPPFRPLPFPCLALLLLLSASSQAPAADALKLSVKPDHATGVYELGEKATWQVDVAQGDRAGLAALPYVVRRDGQDVVAQGTLDLSAGPATITASRGEPGVLLAQISGADPADRKIVASGGAVFAPGKIGPALPAPEDFDAFWQEKLKELAAVPMNPVLEKGSLDDVKNAEGVTYDKVTLDTIRGTHVQAQLMRPAAGEKFPALLIFQSAGVYALDRAMAAAQAKQGWLVLNVDAHDIPVDGPPEFFKGLKEKELKDYVYIGSEDRETSYFLRMVLGCVRAAEYLSARPDWDGRVLAVTGISQGGFQSFATAALYPKVTQLMVLVPAGCDVYGPRATPPRAFCWPYWLSNWGPKDRDMQKVEKTAGYYDSAFFAARVRCPSLVGVGLIDEAARATGVIAAYNAVAAPPNQKELLILPLSDHYGTGGAQVPYFTRLAAWKTALQSGNPPPPASQ